MAHARFDDSGLGESPKPTLHRSDTVLIKALQPVTNAMNRHLLIVVASALFSVLTITGVVLSRPSHVEASEFVDNVGNVIGTGHMTQTLDMVDLARVNDADFYDDIESVLLKDSSGSMTSLRVSSWTWHNASRMQLGATNGDDILIDAWRRLEQSIVFGPGHLQEITAILASFLLQREFNLDATTEATP